MDFYSIPVNGFLSVASVTCKKLSPENTTFLATSYHKNHRHEFEEFGNLKNKLHFSNRSLAATVGVSLCGEPFIVECRTVRLSYVCVCVCVYYTKCCTLQRA